MLAFDGGGHLTVESNIYDNGCPDIFFYTVFLAKSGLSCNNAYCIDLPIGTSPD